MPAERVAEMSRQLEGREAALAGAGAPHVARAAGLPAVEAEADVAPGWRGGPP